MPRHFGLGHLKADEPRQRRLDLLQSARTAIVVEGICALIILLLGAFVVNTSAIWRVLG